MESSPPENPNLKASFRKPSANRNYRRRSPIDGSSSPDVEPERYHSSSPKYSKEDPLRGHDYRERKKDDEKDLTKDASRTHHGKGSDSYGYPERYSSRSSYTHSRHDGHRKRESDYSRSRDYIQDRDRYSRDRYESIGHRSKDREKERLSVDHHKYKDKESCRSDSGRRKSNFEELEGDRHDRDRGDRGEKREYHRSSRDHQSGWDKGDAKEHPNESTAGRDRDGQILVKDSKGFMDVDSLKDEKSMSEEGDRKSPTKKLRMFSSDGGPGSRKVDGGNQISQDNVKANSAQGNTNATEAANDLNAAKFAAMRAAELVNINLSGGAGFMSTEQKKKLLWGNKKSTVAEESTRHWDVSSIADPERQEKFNKLMGVKGDPKPVEQKPGNEDGSSQIRAEKQKELQLNLEKQYTAGLRRRDGRTVGLGL